MVKKIQKITELKTKKEKELYKKVLGDIIEVLNDFNKIRSLSLDRTKQHKEVITKLIINGKVNPKVKEWLNKNSKYDIAEIDDVPADVIRRLKYGRNYLSKKERKLINELKKKNFKRPTKSLIKDLLNDNKVVNLKDYKLWLKNPKKYDLLGVDTIPLSVVGKTATQIQKNYGTISKKKKYSRLSSSTKGVFISPRNFEEEKKRRYVRINRIIKGTQQGQYTTAHEIGHSYDLLKNKFKKPSQRVIEDMIKIADKFNITGSMFTLKQYNNLSSNEIKQLPNSINKYFKYRLSPKELFADSFAYLLYNPKYVKRNSNNFYNYVIKLEPKLKKLIGTERYKQVERIVKNTKKDKKFMAKEKVRVQKKKLNEELKKLKSRKRIGKKTKEKILSIQKKIKSLK